jgi:phosphoribosylformylglycinamidine synthase
MACYDIAKIYGTPFISGKDSLNNEYQIGDTSISIPPTLLISAIGIMEDVRRAISMDLKSAGNLIYVIGDTREELGGSHYLEMLGLQSGNVPKVDAAAGKRIFEALSAATTQGLVRSCHDCSEGGIGVAIAEMCFAGGLGAEINVAQIPNSDNLKRDDKLLFSESNSRFVVEILPEKQQQFEKTLGNIPFAQIGKVTSRKRLVITGLKNSTIIDEDIDDLKEAWKKPLSW